MLFSIQLRIVDTLCLFMVILTRFFLPNIYSKDITGWGENDRGVSWTFGGDVVRSFLEKHDLSLVARAHQVHNKTFFAQLPSDFSERRYLRFRSIEQFSNEC